MLYIYHRAPITHYHKNYRSIQSLAAFIWPTGHFVSSQVANDVANDGDYHWWAKRHLLPLDPGWIFVACAFQMFSWEQVLGQIPDCSLLNRKYKRLTLDLDQRAGWGNSSLLIGHTTAVWPAPGALVWHQNKGRLQNQSVSLRGFLSHVLSLPSTDKQQVEEHFGTSAAHVCNTSSLVTWNAAWGNFSSSFLVFSGGLFQMDCTCHLCVPALTPPPLLPRLHKEMTREGFTSRLEGKTGQQPTEARSELTWALN